jgi:DNA-directed RNA polymerase subunit F
MDGIQNLLDQESADPATKAEAILLADKLRLNWAEVEAYKVQDRKKVQELMEEYVKSNGQQVMAWANYIKLMRVFPEHEQSLRGLFKRGINIVKDVSGRLMLSDLWLEWEKK